MQPTTDRFPAPASPNEISDIPETFNNYLALISGADLTTELFTFAFLDDNAKCAVSGFGTFHGKAADALQKLQELRERYIQAGNNPLDISLHVTLNSTNLAGRKTSNIESCRALCLDLDGVPQEQLDAALAAHPNFAVQSSEPGSGKFHLYWLLSTSNGITLDEWKLYQLAIAQRFGGDKSLDQLTKTIRAPGIPRRTKSGAIYTPELHIWNNAKQWTRLGLLELFGNIGPDIEAAKLERKERYTAIGNAMREVGDGGAGKAGGQGGEGDDSLTKKAFQLLAGEGRNSFLYYAIKRKTARFEATSKRKKPIGYATIYSLARELNQQFEQGPLEAAELDSVIRSAYEHGVALWNKRRDAFLAKLGELEEPAESVEAVAEAAGGASEAGAGESYSSAMNGHANGADTGLNGAANGHANGSGEVIFSYDFSDPWLAGNPFSDLGLCARVLQRYRGELLRLNGEIWAFNEAEKIWKNQMGKGERCQELCRMIKHVIWELRSEDAFILGYCTNKEGFSEDLFKKALAKFESGKKINDVIGIIKKSNQIQELSQGEFDALDNWLHLADGQLLNLDTGEHRPVKATDYQQAKAGCVWAGEWQEVGAAGCPGWLKFLDDIFEGDAGQIQFIQEVFGYTLHGGIHEQVIFCHTGNGANGKSKLLGALLRLMGSYASTLAPDDLSFAAGRFAKPFERVAAKIEGKRLVVLDDLEVTEHWSEATVKNLTGERLRARAEYEQSREILNRAKVHLGLNVTPKPQAENYGLLRRICLIPYEVQFAQDTEASKRIDSMIESELSGILAWAVLGYRRWAKRGRLVMPEMVIEEGQNYENENFTLRHIIKGMYQAALELPQNFIPAQVLYNEVTAMLKAKGQHNVKLDIRRLSRDIKGITSSKNARINKGNNKTRGLYLKRLFDPKILVENDASKIEQL